MEPTKDHLSRRSFLRNSTAGAATFQIIRPELVRGAGKEKLKAGLIGCGGRGRQAVIDLMKGSENVDLVALADIFEDKLEGNLRWMKEQHPQFAGRINVAPEYRFIGFDAYRKLINSGIDIVMLATPPGYRPAHFEAAIEAKKHVFCEKPFGTDPAGVRRFMAAARKSEELKLTVVSGAQRRFQKEYVDNIDRIHNGGIGDVTSLYAYWVGTPVLQQKERDPKWGDMAWEHRNWYSYVWICGDQVVEQHLHNIDVCNWVMGTHPAKVWASGGRAWRPNEELYGNIYDHLSADFEYPNGVRMSSYCRQYPREKNIYGNVSELVVGTRGRFDSLSFRGARLPSGNPYEHEHTALINSIRGDGPYINHAMTVAESTLTCIMAREAAYSGEEVTWDRIMNSQLDLQPKEFGYDVKIAMTPIPVPGKYKLI
ncbi:MAG: Inositol 2-dehydrogenase/D-chiro-inositol 3-dehydrogenase [Bryobacteraceae bacterium]|nr:Inositol 2-dehydrogenase/D-chiro-inositol 3-dehydrogenase [Bryobacteraceae bacterium]